MMNRRHCATGLLVWLVVGALCVQQAGAVGPGIPVGNQTDLTKYEVRVNKLEVSYDNGSTWTTVFEGQSDLVDVAQGASAGSFFSNQSVPVGTINKVRVTLDKDMTVNGTVLYSSTTYYTVADVDNDDSTVGGNRADQDVEMPDGDIVKLYDINVVVTSGQGVVLEITFEITNTDNAIRCIVYPPNDGELIVIPREVTVTITQTS